MPFAWRDDRGRVRKVRQGGDRFIPWPVQQEQEQEQEEEISRGTIVINARTLGLAWCRLIARCEENAEEQRMLGDGHDKFLSRKRKAGGEQEQGLQNLKGHHEIPSRKRKVTDEQEQGLQDRKGQDEIPSSKRDVAEQGLQNLILSLPRDLIVRKVLPCLPLPKIFELRCVSREWKSLLCSAHLMHQCIAAQQGHQAWLVMAGRAPGPNRDAKEFIAYVPSLGRWIPFPLPRSPPISTLLGPHAELLQEGVKFHRQCNPATILMTSAGGLICCIVYNVRPLMSYTPKEGFPNYTILVFNPLTGHMKTLPPISFSELNFSLASLYMIYDQAHNSYKIIVSWRLQIINVYDSKSGSWKITCPHASSSMGILNADLFFYVDKNKNRVYTLHGYHMESDTWSSLIVPAPLFFECRNGGFFLKKLNGRVLLAYDFRPSVAPVDLQGFTVWELNYSSSSLSAAAAWVQVARTPPKFWNQFHDLFSLGDFANDTSFVTSGRLLCMTVADFTDDDYGGYYSTPLVYDLALSSWYRLPPYKGSRRFMGLFSFHPTLNIPM